VSPNVLAVKMKRGETSNRFAQRIRRLLKKENAGRLRGLKGGRCAGGPEAARTMRALDPERTRDPLRRPARISGRPESGGWPGA